MIRLCLFLALAPALLAQIPVDLLIHFERARTGYLATVDLPDITTRKSFGNNYLTDTNRHYIIANAFTNYLSVSCDGTNYGAGTNHLWMDASLDDADTELRVFVGDPSNTLYPHGNVHAFGFVQYRLTNNTGQTRNLDTFVFNNSGGDWTVMQSRPIQAPITNVVNIVAHTANGTSTTGTGNGTITLQMNKTYLFETLRDHTNGVFTVRFRDPANAMALVGEVPLTFPRDLQYALWDVAFHSGYIGLVDGGVVWDNVALRYDSNAQFLTDAELGITNNTATLAGSVTLRGSAVLR